MDRLYGQRKLKRDKAVRDFEFQHPHYSQQMIANVFGISQGQVSKILNPKLTPDSLTVIDYLGSSEKEEGS